MKGWGGTKDGFRNEVFLRHEQVHDKTNIWNDYLFKQNNEQRIGTLDKAFAVCSDKLDERMCNKLIAAHFLAVEKISNTKFASFLSLYEKIT